LCDHHRILFSIISLVIFFDFDLFPCSRLHAVWLLQVSEKLLASIYATCLFTIYFCEVNNSSIIASEHTEFKTTYVSSFTMLCYTHWRLSYCITKISVSDGDIILVAYQT
jgi:hypothetical protein